MSGTGLAVLTITTIVMGGIAVWSKWGARLRRPLRVGDRIRLSGGYDIPPPWLGGRDSITGHVVAFAETDVSRPAAVVKLDEVITFEELNSDIVMLYLRYKDGRWGAGDVVHLELWRQMPPSHVSQEIDSDVRKWVESHVSYRIVTA